MNNNLPDFGKHEAVVVLGRGASFNEYRTSGLDRLPTVGCNSIVHDMRVDVWCSSHANVVGDISEWLNTGNYECAFFVDRFISEDRKFEADMVGPAKELLKPEIFDVINWYSRKDTDEVVFTREPFNYSIPIKSMAGFSSGLMCAEVALRLGAKKIILYGFDYNPNYRDLGDDEAARLLDYHVKYFADYPIPVEYHGNNEPLRQYHENLNFAHFDKLNVIDFSFVSTDDPIDDRYDNWSRRYEYLWALERLRACGARTVHNAACGGDMEVHRIFARQLSNEFNTIHSDVFGSWGGRVYCDITRPWLGDNLFDAVLCISAIEHIETARPIDIIRNLMTHLKIGGRALVTFDCPTVDLAALEAALGAKCRDVKNRLLGFNDTLNIVRLEIAK